ncbi:MAG: response regulator transcription factor [Verrucomicrobia bacterium]|nr:response regulator transcription factor [Verrucomicrobiota bacterium]MDE3100204.1 response regulator transcription factor [Verrucomicrobiota bacterium]
MPITVSIVEDNHGTRDTLVELIGRTSKLSCLGVYHSGEEAIAAIPFQTPDVALVDINLPGMNGIELVAKLKAATPQLQVLILTSYEESRLIFDALRAGASGYLLKKDIPTELVPSIEVVHGGGAPMSVQIARQVVDYFHKIPEPASDMQMLTKREQEVLELLARGFLYKEIGEQLGVSLPTVKYHLRQIYEKLHVQTRTEAAMIFLRRK